MLLSGWMTEWCHRHWTAVRVANKSARRTGQRQRVWRGEDGRWFHAPTDRPAPGVGEPCS